MQNLINATIELFNEGSNFGGKEVADRANELTGTNNYFYDNSNIVAASGRKYDSRTFYCNGQKIGRFDSLIIPLASGNKDCHSLSSWRSGEKRSYRASSETVTTSSRKLTKKQSKQVAEASSWLLGAMQKNIDSQVNESRQKQLEAARLEIEQLKKQLAAATTTKKATSRKKAAK